MSKISPTLVDFEIAPVTSKDDFPSIVAVEDQAFQVSSVMALMFPPNPDSGPSDSLELRISRHQKNWSTDPTSRYFKASLPSGEIIGMAKWNFFLDANSGPQHPWPMDFPETANLELCEHYFGRLDDTRNEAMAGKRHFLMAILVVSPDYQRMGVGNALLESGLREADKEGVDTWVDSSPQGLGLYKKLGWKEIGGTDIDLGRWGGEKGKIRRTVCMVRPPKVQNR